VPPRRQGSAVSVTSQQSTVALRLHHHHHHRLHFSVNSMQCDITARVFVFAYATCLRGSLTHAIHPLQPDRLSASHHTLPKSCQSTVSLVCSPLMTDSRIDHEVIGDYTLYIIVPSTDAGSNCALRAPTWIWTRNGDVDV